MDALGLYLSIPFCRAKCSFCNFASDAFAPGRLPAYVHRLVREIASARSRAALLGSELAEEVDTIYLGGGTPSLLSPTDVQILFGALRAEFRVSAGAEITVECAPGQLSPETLEEFQRAGVNRLSFGVQSFNARETSSIGRLHSPEDAIAEIGRVRSAGVLNVGVDLIAGLPHQTEASWRASVETAIALDLPHVSLYMLEVDEDSRLGREVLAGGGRYGAPAVPSDDATAAMYELACDHLDGAGIRQYEISNFAQPGFQSIHNRRYWERRPYLGFGLDAHSMLPTRSGAVRFANTDDLDTYLLDADGGPFPQLSRPQQPDVHTVTRDEALEETLFLGLRMVDGLSLDTLTREFGPCAIEGLRPALAEVANGGLVTLDADRLRLTARGRVLSNEVFSRLLLSTPA